MLLDESQTIIKPSKEGGIMTTLEKEAQRKERVIEAKSYEMKSGNRCYVVWSVPMNCYLTQERMPLMGEWYDSDGVRHA